MCHYLGVLLLTVIAVVQFSYGTEKFKWDLTESLKSSENFRQNLYEIEFYNADLDKWYTPSYLCKPMFNLEGTRIPKLWAQKWQNMELAVDHELEMGYWWRWPGHMVHLVLETDFKHRPDQTFFKVFDDAITTAAKNIVNDFGMKEGKCFK